MNTINNIKHPTSINKLLKIQIKLQIALIIEKKIK